MTDFQKLYNLYSKDIFRFALFLCGDREEAGEITAETFARAITGKTPLKENTVKGYLLTIARNLYLDSLRRGKKMENLSSKIEQEENSAEHLFSIKTELKELTDYLQTFEETDRTALLLRADGVSYSEIAKNLDITVASAKVKVHRLRLRLAKWRNEREN